EIDRGTIEIRHAHTVYNHLDPIEIYDGIVIEQPLVEIQLVDETRAATRLNGDSQTEVITTLLRQERLHLQLGFFGERDPVSRCRGSNRHIVLLSDSYVHLISIVRACGTSLGQDW